MNYRLMLWESPSPLDQVVYAVKQFMLYPTSFASPVLFLRIGYQRVVLNPYMGFNDIPKWLRSRFVCPALILRIRN